MINIFKKLKEKEKEEIEDKQELLILKLKIFNLEWQIDILKAELEKIKGE